ncbi:hypothetical protein RI129_013026 [Pyrocoelia pectoralis]|uniref:Uncharacterized protein n=1 Tax=Pyrocoelia pectoralis TaxID=417401 RepID=A0AAN7V563_9COLE
MMNNLRFLVLVLLNAIWLDAQLISKFQLCSRSDPKFKECLKVAIPKAIALLSAGIPDLNIPSIDPMKFAEFEAPKIPPLTFDQKYTNIEVHGHTKGDVVEDIDASLTDTDFFLSMTILCPEVDFRADYVYENAIIDGVDYSSKGTTSTMAFNYLFQANFTGSIIKKDGDDYISITDVDTISKHVDDMKITVDADKSDVGNKLAKLLTDNWENYITKQKKKYTAIYSEVYKQEANAIFSQIPYKQLFPK